MAGRSGNGFDGSSANQSSRYLSIGGDGIDLGTATHAGVWVRRPTGQPDVTVQFQIQDSNYKSVELTALAVPADGTWYQIAAEIPMAVRGTNHHSFTVFYQTNATGNLNVHIDDLTVGTANSTVVTGNQHWKNASQAAVTAIRALGDRHVILVGGYQWSGIKDWERINGRPWINDISSDPSLIVYVAHHYWDNALNSIYNPGASPSSVYGSLSAAKATVIDQALRPFIDWGKKYGVRLAITEYGWPHNGPASALTEWNNLGTAYLQLAHSEGISTWYWATGSFWGDYDLNPFLSSNETITGLRPGAIGAITS